MENLGVMYLSSIIKKNKHLCKIVSVDEAFKMTKMWKPDTIGYSIMTGDQALFKSLNEKLMRIYDIDGSVRPETIAGGPHPTFFPEDVIWANILHRGDGESFMARYTGNDFTTDINSYPWPDRTDFHPKNFLLPYMRDFIASRGCNYNCAYCYNDRWAKMFPDHPRIRLREPEDVVREVAYVQPEWAYFAKNSDSQGQAYFQDSCFGTDLPWLRKFSRMYQASVNIPFHCHMRPAQVTEERVVLLVDANCRSIRIALETGSERLRKLIKRGKTSNQEAIDAAKLLRKWGIKLMIQNILGLPTSTIEEDLNTLEVNIKARPEYAWCSIFQPYPGTELGDLCIKEGWYKGDYSEISDSFFENSVLEFDAEHKEQLYCLQKIFALCVDVGYLPKPEQLTLKNFPSLTHTIMRAKGDKLLYPSII